MSANRKALLALCKEVASEFDNWQFINQQFVNRANKGLHWVIYTNFHCRPGFTSFDYDTGVYLPKFTKYMDKVFECKHKNQFTFFEQKLNIRNKSLLKDRWFRHPTPGTFDDKELAKEEIRRWIIQGEAYLQQAWPGAKDDATVLALAKQKEICYQQGAVLVLLAASQGDFDFAKRFYAGETELYPKTNFYGKYHPKLQPKLAELEEQWQREGKLF
ncbi:hypothetical protein HR060_09320 [Catenovulum sp. SM1970]|uniref:hypothetical protein n=1 Tax=Marinifaba aquimaris TaxID=2741323 RepID=UPI001571C3D4|nr:hypothetical protein [Marinifaba aquimaris]NTS77072.1 hypothetical protein [Marinifaba aquimaris]